MSGQPDQSSPGLGGIKGPIAWMARNSIAANLLMILLLMLLEGFSHHSSPYMGIVAFVVLMSFVGALMG